MNEQVTCGQCALKTPDGQTCQLYNEPIEDSGNSCPHGTKTLEKCDICGAKILPGAIVIDMGLDHKTHIICQTCNQAYYSCSTCGQRTICDFETNPIDLPKQVQQQMNTAQGYIVTTIRNPERVRQTCEKGCKCFDKENGCSRQNNYCKQYWIKWKVQEAKEPPLIFIKIFVKIII